MPIKAQIRPENNHTAMRVRDLEASVRFYSEVVGLDVQRKQGDDPNRPTAVFLPGLQLMRATDAHDTTVKGVLDHIGLAVGNMDEIVASLKAAGTGLENDRINDNTRPGQPRVRTCFFRDPEGNRIELIEREG
jgi:catechol 2,3-dioxygenase-like lactoylglutathione lyase family enzyme